MGFIGFMTCTMNFAALILTASEIGLNDFSEMPNPQIGRSRKVGCLVPFFGIFHS